MINKNLNNENCKVHDKCANIIPILAVSKDLYFIKINKFTWMNFVIFCSYVIFKSIHPRKSSQNLFFFSLIISNKTPLLRVVRFLSLYTLCTFCIIAFLNSGVLKIIRNKNTHNISFKSALRQKRNISH